MRYDLRSRLSYADVAEWLAARGVSVDRSTLDDWVQRFRPLYQAAARFHRQRVGRRWRVDETYLRMAGGWLTRLPAIGHATACPDILNDAKQVNPIGALV